MAERLYKIRYSIFLFSFLLVLFGDILISQEWVKLAQTVLILQNMILSLILFMRANELKRMALVLLLTFGAFFSICVYLIPGFSSYPFLIVYWIYFLFVSYQIYYDLMYEKKLGIETISAAFCGFILLGTVFSLLFVSMGSEGAFKGPQGTVSNPDYLYFSFVTLLTIGYGDITPVTEISKKIVILQGMIGHFYSVFVVGIVIGKFLNNQNVIMKD